MQIKMQRFEKVAKKVLNNVADIELYEWPPRCAAIFYQPIRPNRQNIILKKSEDEGSYNATSK